ncbi:ATP-binding protein [Calothrix sp. PCC 7507]|uniref:hybrid sensor histidine kinase/response regulator n=1 Tax=Calothrix sp. PCC 7507 TaxID=99598 RepID=UPI00029F1D25|nr:ATP-binding protein [Calothrix sp. PCC 7507]AFY35805.1 response regulator receiver sensor signal transduction histidine kinase [Calothrix sp. PCC 7507]
MVDTKIFIVEDEILVAREIEGYLGKLGYSVVGIAASAETALKQIAEIQPDLVLVDIVLKGEQDGVSVAKQVCDRFHIPVIYLTAYVDAPTLERAKRTYPFGYILKPFNQNALKANIEIAVARHHAELAEKSAIIDSTNSRSFDYLSILSHELRNPISVIQLSTIMLGDSRYPIDEAKKQQLLGRIQSSTERMNQLIEDVLMMGETNHDTTLFNPEITDIVEFCRTLIEPWQCHPDRQHNITFAYNPDHIYASVDQKLLWHLLNNLVSNAIKYSPDANPIQIRLYGTDEAIYFEIQDQGIGILQEDIEYLFQPFQRGRNVGKLRGTGLGLAIAKRAAELHKGEITVDSQVGCGSTFIVKLPQVNPVWRSL